MKIKWYKPEEWDEDPQAFPNEEMLLLVEIADGENCLIDDVQGSQYCTMGHWYPKIEYRDGTVEEGHWEYVGWDWDQDCFVGTRGDKVIGWAPMPDTQGKRRGGKGFIRLVVEK
jgi:hypothetical protein